MTPTKNGKMKRIHPDLFKAIDSLSTKLDVPKTKASQIIAQMVDRNNIFVIEKEKKKKIRSEFDLF